jgi:hypothetical protein
MSQWQWRFSLYGCSIHQPATNAHKREWISARWRNPEGQYLFSSVMFFFLEMPAIVICTWADVERPLSYFRRRHLKNVPTKYRVFIMQAFQTSRYVVPRGGIFLGKWRSSFTGNSEGKMNVQSACALNTRYIKYLTLGSHILICRTIFLG